jgi:hypothetical protein
LKTFGFQGVVVLYQLVSILANKFQKEALSMGEGGEPMLENCLFDLNKGHISIMAE